MATSTVALGGLLAALAAAAVVWLASLRLRDVSIADICWGPGFALLAWIYCLAPGGAPGPRPLVAAALVTLWGFRLAVHIATRRRGAGEDPRYQAMRAARGPAFWWQSLFVVFSLQAALLWFVALPLLVVARMPQPSTLTAADLLGLLLFLTGFAFEAVGDAQLRRFKASPANRGKVLDTGLWRYTRHPNYFGDALLWWGLYLGAVSARGGWLTMASPALMTFLLLRVSGVTLLEGGLMSSKPGYAAYVARTSAFFPWIPKRKPG
jgi:steroid 5-alpha reductase family enzyme